MDEKKYMQRCIELAKNALGDTYPNPMVGCVIVCDDTIVAEGWHRKSGMAHAEVNAIGRVKDKEMLKKCTLFVNLEPCSHFGKTPPCADLIVESKVKKVVVGTIDPFSKVEGRGIEKIKKAGIEVKVGVLERECKELNKRFFTYHSKKRPYIILKWAQTKDGFIAPKKMQKREPFQISGDLSRKLVHIYRSQEMGILIGAGTAKKDNPSLTTRLVEGKNPIRIVIDPKLTVDSQSQVFDKKAETIVFTYKRDCEEGNVKYIRVEETKDMVEQVLEQLYERQIQSVIVEGGERTINAFMEAGKWDEARVFVSQKKLEDGVKAPFMEKKWNGFKTIGQDILFFYNNDSQ